MARMNRREFVVTAAAGAAMSVVGRALAEPRPQDAAPGKQRTAGPVLIGSKNALRSCNEAFKRMRAGEDPLDAVVAGINIVELDKDDHSVGLGGLPNEDGVVELDSCVMHGPLRKSGAVAGIQRIATPSSVALKVLRRTDHCLLVGEGALRFARAHGFPEQELLTDEARREWLKWKETLSRDDDWLHPETDDAPTSLGGGAPPEFTYGTITCMALTEKGDLFGCTSTSGLSYKIPGRVGDSPIIGAGLFVDNAVGACGSTGRGEANIQNLTSFLVVELMRGGRTPNEACMEAMRRVAEHTEKRLRNAKGEPDYGLILYAIRKDGLVGGASMRGTAKMTHHDGKSAQEIDVPGLYGTN